MGAHEHRIPALHEADELRHLAFVAPRQAQVIARVHLPVGEEAVLHKLGGGKRATDRAFRHRDDDLLAALVEELVQGHEHQRTRLAGGRWGLDQQVLGVALLEIGRAHV